MKKKKKISCIKSGERAQEKFLKASQLSSVHDMHKTK